MLWTIVADVGVVDMVEVLVASSHGRKETCKVQALHNRTLYAKGVQRKSG